MTTLGITDQVRLAVQRQNRVAAIVGAILGSIPPIAAFCFSHYGLDGGPWSRYVAVGFVLACLAFSAPKVFRWARVAFRSWLEAAGFTVLLEGAMTLADHRVLVLACVSYACLATLVVINAIVTACSVALDQKAARAASRAETAPPPSVLTVVRKRPAPAAKARKAGAR